MAISSVFFLLCFANNVCVNGNIAISGRDEHAACESDRAACCLSSNALYSNRIFAIARDGCEYNADIGADVLRRLLQPRNMMSSAVMEEGYKHCVLSAMAILQGTFDPPEIYASLAKIKEKKEIKFAPWGSGSLAITHCRPSPFLPVTNRVSGLMLCNHTNISTILNATVKQCETLLSRRAYIQPFQQVDPDIEQTLSEAVEVVKKHDSAVPRSHHTRIYRFPLNTETSIPDGHTLMKIL